MLSKAFKPIEKHQKKSKRRAKEMKRFQNSILKSSVGFTAIKSSFDAQTSFQRPRLLVLLLHGFTASMATWDEMIQKIYLMEMEKDVDFVMFDFYGSGASSYLPSHLPYSTSVFEHQLNDLLAVLYLGVSFDHKVPGDHRDGNGNVVEMYRPNFNSLSEHERRKIPDIMLVGHSQGGIFAANYGSNHLYDWIKSVLLVTPGGISFEMKDIYHTPWHIVPRTLYAAGSTKWTQKIAIASSYGILTLTSFLLQTTSSLFGLSFFKNALTYIHRFEVVRLKDKERQQYLDMIASMLDHSDLLKDKKDIYVKLSSRKIPLTLVFGDQDSIVPLSAGKRLKETLLESCCEKKGVAEIIMQGTHSLPLERPDELVRVILNAVAKLLI